MSESLSPSLVLGTVVQARMGAAGPQVRLQRLDDPEGVETDWLLIASPMAGQAAGFSFVPEEGDLAVAAFQGHRPVVLGFVYGGGATPPSEEPLERIVQSREGNALVLIDGERSGIILRDKHGNEIRMDAEGISITTSKKLTISAEGTATVQGKTVELNP